MINSVIYYLLESSICLLLFAMVYRLLIANLTHFSWMRVYLLSSVMLSLILPLLILPVHWNNSVHPFSYNFNFLNSVQADRSLSGQTLNDGTGTGNRNDLLPNVIIMITAVYAAGLLFKIFNLAKNLRTIYKCIKQNPKVRDGKFWLVQLKDNVPPFSFFNYIFISDCCQKLPATDLQRIKEHERIHAQQFHSLDVLLIEFISIIFWFNPLMIYLKKSIQEIHEYIVDEKIAGADTGKKGYAELLLKLASNIKGFNLSAGFSGKQIKRRIVMITRPRSLSRHKLIFALLLPVTFLIMLSFSYFNNAYSLTSQTTQNNNINQGQLKIGKITWKGNSVYDTETLNKAFSLKEGSAYNKSLIDDRLNGTSGAQDAVSNLYQDNGYLYNRISFVEEIHKDIADLVITINEGKQSKFNDVIVKIDGKISIDAVDETGIHKGDLFSKAKIMQSIRLLQATGKYDPEKINPKPLPIVTKEEFDKLDIEFDLISITNKN